MQTGGGCWLGTGTRISLVPRNQRQPTPEELDERVKLPLEPDEAIRLIMETGEGEAIGGANTDKGQAR